MRRVFLAAALLPAPALAQVSTNCMAMGPNMVHCDSMDLAPPTSSADGGRQFADGVRQFAEGMAVMRERALKEKLGKMVKAGDCQGAFTYALGKGRFDIAENLKQFCSNSGGATPHIANVAQATLPVATALPRLATTVPAEAGKLSPYEAGRQAGLAALAQSDADRP